MQVAAGEWRGVSRLGLMSVGLVCVGIGIAELAIHRSAPQQRLLLFGRYSPLFLAAVGAVMGCGLLALALSFMLNDAQLQAMMARLGLAGAGIMLALLPLEVYLRLSEEPIKVQSLNHPAFGSMRLPFIHFRMESRADGYANEFQTNADGFVRRGEASPVPGDFRIMLLGDSMLEGLEVPADSNLSVKMGELLWQAGMDAQVFNLGVGGTSPVSHYLAYQYYKEPIRSAVVIAFFFVGNDFTDDARLYHADRIVFDADGRPVQLQPRIDHATGMAWDMDTGGMVPLPTDPPAWRLRVWGLIRSGIPALAQRLFPGNYEAGATGPDGEVCGGLSGELVQRCMSFPARNETLIRNNLFAVFKDAYTADDQADMDLTLGYLSLLASQVEQDGARFYLVILPHPAQIPGQNVGGKPFYGMTKDEVISSTTPQDILADFCDRNHLECLDLLPLLARYQAEPLYLNVDGHFTQLGHSLVAEALAVMILPDQH